MKKSILAVAMLVAAAPIYAGVLDKLKKFQQPSMKWGNLNWN